MTLSRWVLLATVAGCCGLMFGEASASATDSSSSMPNLSLAAKHYLRGLKEQQHGFDAEDTEFNRRLQTRACGDEIGRVTESEMRALASAIFTYLLEDAPGLLETTLKYFTKSLRYDVVAYKVCGSCEETQASMSEQALLQDESVFGAFSSYCASDKYGYSAQHSALVLVPVTANTTTATARSEMNTILEGSLRSFVSMHITKVSVNGAPTQAWPTISITEALTLAESDENFDMLVTYITYLAPLVAAGSGAVTIEPDYIGYGASVNTHNRTYGYPPTYMQAAVTSWMATKQAIEEDTYGWSINDGNGCTAMDSVVSVAGDSEGGYAAIAAGPALQQAGVRVLSISAGATFLDPGEQIEFVIESFDTGLVTLETDNAIFYSILPLSGFAFSSGNPGLANSGTEQLALASDWRVPGNFDRDIIAWVESPGLLTREEVGSRMLSTYVPDICNADYLDLVRQARAANATSLACDSEFVLEGVTDKLCEAINSVSLLTVVANIDIPLQLCYSEDDTVVSSRVYTDSNINIFGNANVKKYSGPLGLLPVTGDHADAVTLCSVAPLERFLDVQSVDRSNLISPLMGEQAAVCALSKTAPSSAPAEMPPSGATWMISRVATSSGIALAVTLLLFFVI